MAKVSYGALIDDYWPSQDFIFAALLKAKASTLIFKTTHVNVNNFVYHN